MEECSETVVIDGLTPERCPEHAVLYGRCEAHLTDRERAVLELVRAAEESYDAMREPHGEWKDLRENTALPKLRRAIAAVREEK